MAGTKFEPKPSTEMPAATKPIQSTCASPVLLDALASSNELDDSIVTHTPLHSLTTRCFLSSVF